MCRAVCSAGGDVNKQEEEFGIILPQQTEGMKIKLWANYTFLQIVICLFFLFLYSCWCFFLSPLWRRSAAK